MSHFTVLVIGPNIEAQLAPFDENLETAPRLVEVSAAAISDACVRRAEREGAVSHSLEALAAEISEHEGGEHVVHGDKIYEVRTSNEQGHWDWWVVGGRWAGYFPLKPEGEGRAAVQGHSSPRGWVPATTRPVRGTDVEPDPKVSDYEPVEAAHADQCVVGAVDFEKARAVAEAKAREDFGKWRACFEGHPRPLPWVHFFEEVQAKRMTIEEARLANRSQPAIAAWDAGEGRMWVACPVREFGFDEEAYVARRRARALVPYAYVKDGKWHAKGRMGWFGCSDAWNRHVADLYASLPADAELTLVDCHV